MPNSAPLCVVLLPCFARTSTTIPCNNPNPVNDLNCLTPPLIYNPNHFLCLRALYIQICFCPPYPCFVVLPFCPRPKHNLKTPLFALCPFYPRPKYIPKNDPSWPCLPFYLRCLSQFVYRLSPFVTLCTKRALLRAFGTHPVNFRLLKFRVLYFCCISVCYTFTNSRRLPVNFCILNFAVHCTCLTLCVVLLYFCALLCNSTDLCAVLYFYGTSMYFLHFLHFLYFCCTSVRLCVCVPSFLYTSTPLLITLLCAFTVLPCPFRHSFNHFTLLRPFTIFPLLLLSTSPYPLIPMYHAYRHYLLHP
jgi:hypothetical protein